MSKPWAPAALIVVVGLVGAVYLNSFPGAFHYDDYPLLLEQPGITGEDFPYSWFLLGYGGRPLTLWTFHLNDRWSGADPKVFHGVSVALHLAATALLGLLLGRETGRWFPAVAAAAVFGLHPLQSQAVNYIWSRSMLLMAVFSLAALLVVRRVRCRTAALVLFQAAVWSRGEALVLAIPLAWMQPSLRVPLLALATLNLGSLAAGLVILDPSEVAWNHGDVMGYWLTAPAVLARYLSMMVWPDGWSIFHGSSPASGPMAPAAVVLAAAALAVVWRFRRTIPEMALGGGWIVLWLVPSLLVPNSDPFNESRAYLAMAGFAWAVAGTGARVLADTGLKRRLPGLPGWWAAAVGVWLVILSTVTLDRNRIWQDDVALWQEAVERVPDQYLPRYNLGVALARQGRIREAEVAFQAGTRLNPADDMSYSGLGFCAEIQGQWRIAAGFYAHALNLNPASAYAQEALERVTANLDTR
jgi:tetratricopeptide (TPR) repeat protein